MPFRIPSCIATPALISAGALLIVLASVTTVCALEFDSGDSLCVRAAGAGGAQFHEPSAGPKAFADGLLYASFRHSFSSLVYSEVAVRGSTQGSLPFLHQAVIGLCGERFDVRAGFVTERLGALRYYRTTDYLGPTFDQYLLWDTYGVGVSGARLLGVVDISGGLSISTRESGSLHLSAGIANDRLRGQVIAGIQSYESWTQDNVVSVGGEGWYERPKYGAHLLGLYRRYMGYGSATNATMRAGWGMDLAGEVFAMPVPQMRLAAMGRFERSFRAVERTITTAGVEFIGLPRYWGGAGLGCDLSVDGDIVTWVPGIVLTLMPAPGHTDLRIRLDRRQTAQASPTWTVSGGVWIDF